MNTEEEEVKQLLNEAGQDAEQEKLQEALEKPSVHYNLLPFNILSSYCKSA
jgi:hypothetical protein